MFGIEFLTLKIAGAGIVGGGLYYLYQKYKDQTKVDDFIIDKVKALYVKAEADVEKMVVVLEKKIEESKVIEQAKDKILSDIVKAREVLDKIKNAFN